MGLQEKLKVASHNDGLNIGVLFMMPDVEGGQKCRGVVQIVHGMSEYKERYLPFMEFLAEQGYASIIHDHRGHGESVKSKQDYGYMYEVGTDAFLRDIMQINELAREKVPGVPVIMFGHSMGSLAARSLMRTHDSVADALILSGAPCKNPAVDAAILLAKLQKKIFGSRHTANLLGTLSFMAYAKRFAGEGSNFAWINSDPEAVAAYDADPACGFTFTVDGFLTLFELMKRTFTEKGWKCSRPDMPILFIAGADDPCIENKDKFEEEMDYMRRAGYKDVRGILYNGMRHEICSEPDKQKVYEDVTKFLREKAFRGCSCLFHTEECPVEHSSHDIDRADVSA